MAVQSCQHTLNVERRKPKHVEHGCKGGLTAEPSPPVRVFSRGWIVTCELLYRGFNQRFAMCLAIGAKGKKEHLGKVVQHHTLTLRAFVYASNHGQT